MHRCPLVQSYLPKSPQLTEQKKKVGNNEPKYFLSCLNFIFSWIFVIIIQIQHYEFSTWKECICWPYTGTLFVVAFPCMPMIHVTPTHSVSCYMYDSVLRKLSFFPAILPFGFHVFLFFSKPETSVRVADEDMQEGVCVTAWITVSSNITGKTFPTPKQQGFFAEVESTWNGNFFGGLIWNIFFFLSKILHQSNGTDILNAPLGLCATWLMMINHTKHKNFSLCNKCHSPSRWLPSLCDFQWKNPEVAQRRRSFIALQKRTHCPAGRVNSD